MGKFVIVNNGIVDNIIIGDELRAVELILPDEELIYEEPEDFGGAFIGATYDYEAEKVIPYQPYASWSFDRASWTWVSPKPQPVMDGKIFVWEEEVSDWVEFTFPEPTV